MTGYFKTWCLMGMMVLLGAHAHAAPYFASETISPTLLTPPPKTDSAEELNEIQTIVQYQEDADPREVARAEDERTMRPELVAEAVDAALTREAYPKLYALLDRVSDTSRAATDAAKDFWHTKRPYLVDTRVKALIDPHDNPAYPSGHTSGSFAWAQVLGMVLPEKRAAFMARADEIALHRVLVGMHFPHDLDGGREMALLVVGGLVQNAEFQRDLEAAKQELNQKR